jgi:hypothetical protein
MGEARGSWKGFLLFMVVGLKIFYLERSIPRFHSMFVQIYVTSFANLTAYYAVEDVICHNLSHIVNANTLKERVSFQSWRESLHNSVRQ